MTTELSSIIFFFFFFMKNCTQHSSHEMREKPARCSPLSPPPAAAGWQLTEISSCCLSALSLKRKTDRFLRSACVPRADSTFNFIVCSQPEVKVLIFFSKKIEKVCTLVTVDYWLLWHRLDHFLWENCSSTIIPPVYSCFLACYLSSRRPSQPCWSFSLF